MENQQLIDFIKQSRQIGKSDSQIREELLGAGWDVNHINQVIEFLEEEKQLPSFSTSKDVKLPGVLSLFKEAFDIFKKRLGLLVSLQIIPATLLIIVSIISNQKSVITSILSPVFYMVGMIFFIFASGAIIKIADKNIETNYGYAFKEGKSKAVSLLLVGLLVTLVILGGTVLLIIPGIIFSGYFLFSTFVLFHEGLRGRQSLIRSKELVKGNWWQVFWKSFIIGILINVPVYIILSVLFRLGVINNNVRSIINSVINVFSGPLYVFYLYVIYNYLREIKGPPVLAEPVSKLVKYIVVGIFGALVIPISIITLRITIMEPFSVTGHAMDPNFINGQYLLIKKWDKNYQRGDVVIFKYVLSATQGQSSYFIKRIIGLPGENILIQSGRVYVNGQPLDETNYLPSLVQTFGDTDITLGQNEYYLLGDNRTASSDSRLWGPILKENITGKYWTTLFGGK